MVKLNTATVSLCIDYYPTTAQYFYLLCYSYNSSLQFYFHLLLESDIGDPKLNSYWRTNATKDNCKHISTST